MGEIDRIQPIHQPIIHLHATDRVHPDPNRKGHSPQKDEVELSEQASEPGDTEVQATQFVDDSGHIDIAV